MLSAIGVELVLFPKLCTTVTLIFYTLFTFIYSKCLVIFINEQKIWSGLGDLWFLYNIFFFPSPIPPCVKDVHVCLHNV